MRAQWGGLIVVGLLAAASSAQADAVSAGPDDCPAGALPEATHDRRWCAPLRPCRTVTDCSRKTERSKSQPRWDPSDPMNELAPGTQACVEVGLCVERPLVPSVFGGAPYPILEAVASCERGDPCADGSACGIARRCAPVAALEDPDEPARFGCAAAPTAPSPGGALALLALLAVARRWPLR